jgi:sugar-specific transcriptional regulator TrmB
LGKEKESSEKKKPEITQEIKDAMKNLGFTEYYINIYLTLLINKELDARELSDKAGVPYSRIYEVLNDMIKRNIIKKIDGRPSTFIPNNPVEVFIEFKKKYEQDIQENISKCSEFLSDLYSPEENVEDIRFKLMKGNRQSLQHFRNMLKNAVKEIWGQLSDFEEVFPAIEEELRYLKIKGVKMKVIIDSKYRKSEMLKDVEWISVFFKDNVVNSFLLIDNEIAAEAKKGKFIISDPKSEEWILFQSNSSYYLTYIREILQKTFDSSELHQNGAAK